MSAHRNENAPARDPHHEIPRQHPGQSGSGWPRSSPLPTDELPGVSICDAIGARVTADSGGNPGGTKSGYDNSRGNACTHGMRGEKVFPADLQELIDLKIIAFVAEMKPQGEWETFLVEEIARATVLVKVCGQRLIKDEVRVRDRLDECWEADAHRRIDRLVARLPRDPQLMVRALESTKQGTEFIVSNLRALADIAENTGFLDDVQRDMLFTLLGVPHELRRGSRKVSPAGDGPALVTLINKEVARHDRNLVGYLNQQDARDLRVARTIGSPYRDKITRQLRSDEARNVKRLVWAKAALEQLRSGAAPDTVIDPRTKKPIVPEAKGAPASAPAPAAPTTSPPPDDAEPASIQEFILPELPAGMSQEDRESLQVFAGTFAARRAELRAQHQAAVAASAQPQAGSPPPS